MPRIRLIALLVLFAVPQLAHAEPYTPPTLLASYTTTLVFAPGQDALYTGVHGYYDDMTGTMTDVFSYAHLPTAIDGFIDSQSSEIRFAGQSKESYYFTGSAPIPGSPNDTDAFLVKFTLTDLASGQSGELQFPAVAVLNSALPAELRGESNLYAGYSSSASALVLGANRYEFRFHGGDTDSNAWLFADVSVTAATPEPGTMAMAGMGIISLFGLRRRLRLK